MAARRKKLSQKKLIGIIAFVVLCLVVSVGELTGAEWIPSWSELFGAAELTDTPPKTDGDAVVMRVLDVGQGESVLIQTKEKNVLIDAAEKGEAPGIISYLEECGVKKLDLVIATHPHADHIGGMAGVLEAIPADEVIMPKLPRSMTPTTSAYTKMLAAIEDGGCKATYAQPGMQYDLGSGAVLIVEGPVDSYDDLNSWSVVSRVVYGSTAFLVTGDAEKDAEEDLVASGADLSADVLVLGHHGSSTSSCQSFLNAVKPRYAAITCGLDNDYGHPHAETVERLDKMGIEYYRTDLQGAITFQSDGTDITVAIAK
ncbi:MAG: ComEC/Rec2 family competence protein [Oscillospiraceae bacterium]|nr:ComEC/Rec2 family competence protein [Oscillospiraceae bacterium]